MIFSKYTKNVFDKNVTEHISYVIRQCVEFKTPCSLRGVSQYDSHNIYLFEFSSLPSFGMLHLFSLYFDTMSIDVNKEQVLIKLTFDINKDIPF